MIFTFRFITFSTNSTKTDLFVDVRNKLMSTLKAPVTLQLDMHENHLAAQTN